MVNRRAHHRVNQAPVQQRKCQKAPQLWPRLPRRLMRRQKPRLRRRPAAAKPPVVIAAPIKKRAMKKPNMTWRYASRDEPLGLVPGEYGTRRMLLCGWSARRILSRWRTLGDSLGSIGEAGGRFLRNAAPYAAGGCRAVPIFVRRTARSPHPSRRWWQRLLARTDEPKDARLFPNHLFNGNGRAFNLVGSIRGELLLWTYAKSAAGLRVSRLIRWRQVL